MRLKCEPASVPQHKGEGRLQRDYFPVNILRPILLESPTLQRTSTHGRALVHKSVNFPLRRAHQIAPPNQTETELGFFRVEQECALVPRRARIRGS